MRTNLKLKSAAAQSAANEDIHIITSRRDYVIPATEVPKYRKTIHQALNAACFIPSLDKEVTGAAHSRVIGELRKAEVYVPSDFDAQLRLFEQLGYRVRRGRVAREYRSGNLGWAVEGIVVFE